MENKKASLLDYREKKDVVYSKVEIKNAFETSFAICFGLDQSDSMKERGKYKLFSQIFDINSDVIITQADLCVLFGMPTALRNQFLIINKNATKETNNELVALIENSEVVTSAYCFFSEKKEGIKGCYYRVFASEKPFIIRKGNLLIDGDSLLLTVRS